MIKYLYLHDYNALNYKQTNGNGDLVPEDASSANRHEEEEMTAPAANDDAASDHLHRPTSSRFIADPASDSDSDGTDPDLPSFIVEDATDRLMNNVRLYAVADYYNISDLKELAHEKICGILERKQSSRFAEIVEMVS